MSNDPLLRPYQLKHLTLRNRIMITSHEPAYPEDGMPKARYRAYHVERAKAGVALTMTAGSASVSRDSPPAFNNILVWKDEVVGWMKQLVDECHDHGAAVMIQLTHLGRRTRWDTGDWLPVLAPSHEREAAHRAFPKRLEDWDMARVIGDFADAAERMKAAGVDGVELEAYGHLLEQFWSPLTNDLEAPFGGNLDNRLRFAFDVIRAVRDRCGTDFIVGLRYTGDQDLPGGMGKAEGLEVSRKLKDSGLVDFLNVIRGHIDTDPGLTDVIPIQGMRSAPHLDFAGEIRAATQFPTFHAARIPDVATARHAIASGKLDMVGMTRAHMADPHLVRKVIEGREDDIRPCVGANYCLDRIYQGGMAFCIHNPATGRELTMPHVVPRAKDKRRITIVGAGPAGLECAMTLGQRGYEIVHLVDAAEKIGGHLNWVSSLPGFGAWKRVIDWRETQINTKTQVQIQVNSSQSYEDILESGADHVIFATGSHWDRSGMSALLHDYIAGTNADLPEIATPEQYVLEGKKMGKNVLVIDNDAYYMGSAMAQLLAQNGHQVTYVTYGETVGPYQRFTLEEQRTYQKLVELGCTMIAQHIVVTTGKGEAVLVHLWSGQEKVVEYDSIMLVTHRISDCKLYDQLQAAPEEMQSAGIKSIHLIGDAHTPGMIAQATFSGTRLAREFDSENPDEHKPFIRERRLLGSSEADFQLDAESLRRS